MLTHPLIPQTDNGVTGQATTNQRCMKNAPMQASLSTSTRASASFLEQVGFEMTKKK